MESRCPGCFHPRSVDTDAATATCPVCDAARTSPFGVSPAKPERPARTMPGPFGASPAHRQTSLFGVPAATLNTFPFCFPPTPPEPAQTSLFSQTSFLPSPTPSAFTFTPPEPAQTSLFGQISFPPPTPCGVTYTPGPAQTSFPFQPFGSVRTDTATFVFDDDEPVEKPPEAPLEAASNGGPLVLKTHCELPAVARGCAREGFAVLVHAMAPSAATDHTAPRALLDLVTVLDVSGSTAGRKIELLKEAMGFVVDKLGPADRLSVVSFSHDARRVSPLKRMSDAGKASAKLAVQSLVAGGGTNILKGLQMAADVLDGRRHRNAVASVVLLSDGQDNDLEQSGLYGREKKTYQDLVPRSLAGGDRSAVPIHTFGFGTDHDAAAMHAVAEATGGTFSFIENQAVVQDAFAQCIGGLLSVVAQEAWIAVTCPHPDVRVRAVKSGRYESRVGAYGRAASVDVGELYADEERGFLLFVDVPTAADDDDITHLVKVSCTYKDTATRKSMKVTVEDAVVRRPAEVASEDHKPSTEVELERFRVEATEDIAAARAAADRGDHGEAARILDRRRQAAPAGLAGGDARCAALVFELGELSARVASRREYEQKGRACVLSGMSSHAQQRASSVSLFATMSSTPFFGSAAPGSFGAPSPCGMAAGAYATPAMKAMVDSSRETREQRQQQQSPPPTTTTMPNSASIFAPNNGSN